MNEASFEQIELARVGNGVDLWPAIEAAQYAHVLDHDEPRSEPEREAIVAFGESFVRWVEEWEQRPREVQSSILDDLGRHLTTLSDRGLALYGTTIEREVETEAGQRVRLPIALLKISGAGGSSERIHLAVGTSTA